MRNTAKLFTITIALTAILAAPSALAAQSRENRGTREPSVITRIIQAIKKQIRALGDGIQVPPPTDH